MISILPQNIARFIILVLLQVLILNNIQLSGFINPYIYILFILLLPFETPAWLLLILGFVTGLAIDIFSGTIGMHATATTLAAYSRPFILTLFSPRDGYESRTSPTLKHYDIAWIIRYTVVMILIHHSTLFFIEIFRFSGFFYTMLRILISSAFTFVLIILSQFLFYKK
ncbi:MAG: rod shape-determining protein MreD [Bacteroidia bacterium]|nr:rod shape-determining protein MreD [Bacteroidia bacterium]